MIKEGNSMLEQENIEALGLFPFRLNAPMQANAYDLLKLLGRKNQEPSTFWEPVPRQDGYFDPARGGFSPFPPPPPAPLV